MKTLLTILASLLLAAPTFGQAMSGRGLADNMATTSLPTCNGGLVGYRLAN